MTTYIISCSCAIHPVSIDGLFCVADDSLLRQAKILELKGNVGLSRSNTKPDAETSHAPTAQDNSGVF
jgi:hypothetical protein